jgi:hypothetical protein
MVWFVGSYGVAIVGYVVLNAAASRLLGAQDFGYFVVAITATTLLGQIGLLGVHRSGLREAATMDLTDLEGLALLRRGVRAVSLVPSSAPWSPRRSCTSTTPLTGGQWLRVWVFS